MLLSFTINYCDSCLLSFTIGLEGLYYSNQHIYKNRVKSDRKIFEIPALLSGEWGNLAGNCAGKFKKYM